ncbi:MAG: DUF4394 domain-containing protein [Betaproteobacteria bacterium]|nr:DUF4394 domain-containing protein [Betaproteobacteria bacterium]
MTSAASPSRARRAPVLTTLTATLMLTGCATTPEEPLLPLRKENIVAVTAGNQLITFNAGQPAKILSKKALTGLQPGEEIAGIDFRVAKGVLYALGKTGTVGRLYTIDVASGKAAMVGSGPFAVALEGDEFGFDFNPTVDRIRLVSNTGLNTRLHPDTGAAVDANPNAEGLQTDGRLAYANSDPNAGKTPAVMAAGYTYNKQNDKITTNFAVDGKLDMLVMQGSKEGATTPVSPNTGQLFTVGRIGAGESARVSFDISDVSNTAFGAFTKAGASSTRFYLVNLENGAGTFQGTIGGGEVVKGIAIEP